MSDPYETLEKSAQRFHHRLCNHGLGTEGSHQLVVEVKRLRAVKTEAQYRRVVELMDTSGFLDWNDEQA